MGVGEARRSLQLQSLGGGCPESLYHASALRPVSTTPARSAELRILRHWSEGMAEADTLTETEGTIHEA